MIRTIWIREKGKKRLTSESSGAVPLRFPSYITTNDIQLLIQETLQSSNQPEEGEGEDRSQNIAIGLLDDSQRFYPLSMVKIYPEIFTKGIFTIIYLNDSFETQNEDHDNDYGEEALEDHPNENYEKLQNDAETFPSSSAPNLPLRFLDGYFHLVCEDIRSRTGLDSNKIGVYLQSLNQFSSTNDVITKGRFLSSMVFALHQHSAEEQRHQDLSLPVTPDINAIFEEIFDTFVMFTSQSSPDERETTSSPAVDIIRLSRFLALFSGGLANENIKILYHLFDYDQDGFLSFNDLSNCFREILLILSHLYGPMLEITQSYSLDAIALSLAQSVVHMGKSLKWENDYISDENDEEEDEEMEEKKINYSGDGVLSLQQFYQWYSNTDNILYLPPSRSPQLTSYQHISAAKNFLSFRPMTCSSLKLCLQHYSEKSQASFISSVGVYSSVILSFRLHQTDLFSLHQSTALKERDIPSLVMPNTHFLMALETFIQNIFELHDPLHSDCVAIEDIFASLSLFLDASWKDRLASYFQLNSSSAPRYQLHLNSPDDASLDLLLTEISMIDYLVSILKTIALFESSVVDDDTLLHQATQLIRHALSTGLIASQPHKLIALSDFVEWLESNIDLGGNGTDTETQPVVIPKESIADNSRDQNLPAAAPSLSSAIQEELKFVKEELGLVGFTAEDFMDLLGEYADAGTIALSDWLHIVALLTQLNSSASQSKSSSSSELASKIFHSLSSLTSSASSEDTLEYRILLSSLIMFCDSPVEDKIAVIFTVLSETIYGASSEEADREEKEEDLRRVTSDSFLFLLECVLTLLGLLSPSSRKVFLRATSRPSTSVLARETLLFGMRRFRKIPVTPASLKGHSFSMSEFCGLLWAMLGEQGVVSREETLEKTRRSSS
jgi:hypothetical protein